jgi:hypothetical protein
MGCQYLMKLMSVKCHAFLLLVKKKSETDKVMVKDAAFTGQNID